MAICGGNGRTPDLLPRAKAAVRGAGSAAVAASGGTRGGGTERGGRAGRRAKPELGDPQLAADGTVQVLPRVDVHVVGRRVLQHRRDRREPRQLAPLRLVAGAESDHAGARLARRPEVDVDG